MNIITGYIAPTEGTVKVNGFDILKNPIKAKSQIGYLPEQPPLYLDMTVKGYLKFIYDLKKVKLDKNNHIKEVCEKVGIADVYNRPIKKLSKGYKQRVGIAQALIGYPPLIILDEPTVGLDPKQLIYIRELIKDLAKDHTTIFSSHILHEVQMICDRVIVIHSGKIVADKPTKDIINGSLATIKKIVANIEGEPEKVLKILENIDGVTKVKKSKKEEENTYEYIIDCEGENGVRKKIFSKLAQNGLALTKLDVLDTSLESAFLNLISENRNEEKDLKDLEIKGAKEEKNGEKQNEEIKTEGIHKELDEFDDSDGTSENKTD